MWHEFGTGSNKNSYEEIMHHMSKSTKKLFDCKKPIDEEMKLNEELGRPLDFGKNIDFLLHM
ncbi:hypothetical protein J437_LFUL007821, partial [Ladona fulva]